MIPVLYAANTTDFSSFGLGVLTDTISCEVTEERNGVFECLLKYPVSGQHYGLITKECIIKAKPNDTAADQAFRIYRITKPLNGIVTIYGQHISYDLANVPVLPFSTESRSPQLIQLAVRHLLLNHFGTFMGIPGTQNIQIIFRFIELVTRFHKPCVNRLVR